jgi:hypothetical protein
MSEEQTSSQQPADEPLIEAPHSEPPPVEPPLHDARRRLRELLAIPERDRSDAVWDEIINIEIDLAPGNRASAPQGDNGRRQDPGQRQHQGRRPDQQAQRPGQNQNPAARKKQGKRFFQKRKRGPGLPGER